MRCQAEKEAFGKWGGEVVPSYSLDGEVREERRHLDIYMSYICHIYIYI